MGRECGYCGKTDVKLTRDHVVSACLYPGSKASSKIQRITVPAYFGCNGSWADDEADFRTVVLMAGESNAAVEELWPKVFRGFREIDGERRTRDVRQLMEPVQRHGADRWMIYPGPDDRVLRVVRKIVRGLAYYHGLGVVASDAPVCTDVLKFPIPAEFLEEVTFLHREPDAFQYWFEAYEDGDFTSLWYLRFFERLPFIASVAAAEPTGFGGESARPWRWATSCSPSTADHSLPGCAGRKRRRRRAADALVPPAPARFLRLHRHRSLHRGPCQSRRNLI